MRKTRRENGNRARIMIATFLIAAVALVVIIESASIVSASGKSGSLTPLMSYGVNGLTCPLPLGTSQKVGIVVQHVVQSSQFLAATKGIPYALYYVSNLTQRSQTYGNATTTLPDALELGFATYGSGTPCAENGHWSNWIDVQVPLESGSFIVSAESVHSTGGPK